MAITPSQPICGTGRGKSGIGDHLLQPVEAVAEAVGDAVGELR